MGCASFSSRAPSLDTAGERVHKWRGVAPHKCDFAVAWQGPFGNAVGPGGFARVDAAAAPATVCGKCPPIATGPMRAGKGVTHIDP